MSGFFSVVDEVEGAGVVVLRGTVPFGVVLKHVNLTALIVHGDHHLLTCTFSA